MELKTTEKLSPKELSEEANIGKALCSLPDGQVRAAWQVLLSSPNLYYPVPAVRDLDSSGFIRKLDMFVLIKQSDVVSRVPSIKEVREDVILAWKMRASSKLAEAAAKKIAKEASDTKNKTLAEYYAGKDESERKEVTETDYFTSLKMSIDNRKIQLDKVYGVEDPGPAFIEKAFAMEPGEVLSLSNHDRSVFYIVRKIGHAKKQEVLQQLFRLEANRWPGRDFMVSIRQQRKQRQFYNKLFEAFGYVNKAPLDAPRN